MIRHDVKTYCNSCKYVMAYHQVSDGLPSLRVTMWIERLSLLVIGCREKLSTRLCMFFKGTKTIQSEWIFLQRITWDTGGSFAGVEKIIRETFLPRLFFGKTKTLSPVIGALSMMPVNKSRLGPPESSDVISVEVLNLHVMDRRTGMGRDRRGGGSPM